MTEPSHRYTMSRSGIGVCLSVFAIITEPQSFEKKYPAHDGDGRVKSFRKEKQLRSRVQKVLSGAHNNRL